MSQPASDSTAPAVKTTCPYCGVGCGVLATPDGQSGVAIAGDPDHPANFGRLCSKGSALGETVDLGDRLLDPIVDGRTATWEGALGTVAGGLRRIAEQHGPDAIAFYLSGQILTEDYYVANKLAKGFLGTPHVDTNSRLCMSSAVAAHRRAFGSDTVPGCYEDLDEADLIVLVGSNAAWCHPILFRRMMDARKNRGTKIVTVDPRRTQTGEEADLHLGLQPGTDTALFSGLLVHLAGMGKLDLRFIEAHTAGFEGALERARQIAPDIAATARATGLAEADVQAFFELFARTKRVVTGFSQGRTSRRRAPTRATPSSTAISPPGGSASPAWARSRSPASPTPWAGARSAAWPTCSPPTCTSRRKRWTGSAVSGRRPTSSPARA
ncbi:hypothetical protein GCM10025880_02960 [Methylorubrum aminovorans]|nr:hypothetical protein GCM10025880_02960 [Methylorubrum aminovorans]